VLSVPQSRPTPHAGVGSSPVTGNIAMTASPTYFKMSPPPAMTPGTTRSKKRKLLDRAGLSIDRIDAFEVNEAFASVVLAWMRATGADPDRVNRFGGAVALGHPVGASGGRLLGNLLAALEDTGGCYGLQTMCESGGMANATLIQRL
jgi:hypothetical protein